MRMNEARMGCEMRPSATKQCSPPPRLWRRNQNAVQNTVAWLSLLTVALATARLAAVGAFTFEIDLAGQREPALSQAVLFPFDSFSVPFRHGLQLELISAQWNAPLHSDDRRDLRMDIGLLVSADGLHYHEPIPDFRIIEAREEGWRTVSPTGDPPRLAQGQGVVNLGDKTVTWYSIWAGQGSEGIRAAWWRRDRLGYFHATRAPIEGQTWLDEVKPHFISAPIRLPAGGGRVFLNASHLSEHARLAVEILDEQFRPVPDHTAAQCEPFRDDSAFRLPVRWQRGDIVQSAQPVRVRVDFDGLRLEDARVYAVYVEAL